MLKHTCGGTAYRLTKIYLIARPIPMSQIPCQTRFKSFGVTMEPWETKDSMWILAIIKEKTFGCNHEESKTEMLCATLPEVV
jgi:hypothetical protein